MKLSLHNMGHGGGGGGFHGGSHHYRSNGEAKKPT